MFSAQRCNVGSSGGGSLRNIVGGYEARPPTDTPQHSRVGRSPQQQVVAFTLGQGGKEPTQSGENESEQTRQDIMTASVTGPLVRVATAITFTIVVAIAIGDIIKPSREIKITAMEGELKVHTDVPIGVFSFAAMQKTFNARISNASTVKFNPILQDPLYLDLLANAKLFPYDSTTTHRCIVRNNSFVYGWCEEMQSGDGSWAWTHIVIYQPVMAAEQVIAASANNAMNSATVKTWVMAEVLPDTQTSYVQGHMSLGNMWIPGLSGLATRIPCEDGFDDRMCVGEVLLAARGIGISSSIVQQIFAVRSKTTGIVVLFIPQADSENYASGTARRHLFKVLLTPRFSLSSPAYLDDPTKGVCYIVSFRRSSQENQIDVGNWRLAYWIQVTSFIAIVHLLTMRQKLGPVQRFIIILRLPIFTILAAQTVLLAAQEFKVLMILRYRPGWRNDLVHRILVLTYAYIVICCHAILSSREYSVSKAQYVMLGVVILSGGAVIGVTRRLSLPSSAPNQLQACYYCRDTACTDSSCCTANFLYWEIAAVVVIYLIWITVSVIIGAVQTVRSKKSSTGLVVPNDAPKHVAKVEFRNNFERRCLNSTIIAEYRLHNIYRAIGDRCATTDLGLALTGYCATRDHLLRIAGVTFSSLALLLPKWIVRHVPVTVTAWPLHRFEEVVVTKVVKDAVLDESNAGFRKRDKGTDATSAAEVAIPKDVEPMVVKASCRVHISDVSLQWGHVERVYL